MHVTPIDPPDSAIFTRTVASALCLHRSVLRAEKIQGCAYVTLLYVSPSSVRQAKRVAENITIQYVSRTTCILMVIDTHNPGNVFVHIKIWVVFDP